MEAWDTCPHKVMEYHSWWMTKKLSVTSAASPVNQWWKTAHLRTVRCTLLTAHEVQLRTHELAKAGMKGKDKVTVVVTILSDQFSQCVFKRS